MSLAEHYFEPHLTRVSCSNFDMFRPPIAPHSLPPYPPLHAHQAYTPESASEGRDVFTEALLYSHACDFAPSMVLLNYPPQDPSQNASDALIPACGSFPTFTNIMRSHCTSLDGYGCRQCLSSPITSINNLQGSQAPFLTA